MNRITTEKTCRRALDWSMLGARRIARGRFARCTDTRLCSERTGRLALDKGFDTTGILGPISVLTAEESRRLKAVLSAAPPPVDWGKGHGANSLAYYEMASHPAIVDRVAAIIGDDVMLWGASLVTRQPGQEHPWHTDIETSADAPGTVTVWIGLENTTRDSALRLIPYSHRFRMTIQERAARAGKCREEVNVEDVLIWAREFDPRCGLIQLDMGDGDAVLFDGRVWHGSLNTNYDGVRTALLLQYATPARAMRIPDLSQPDFPFRSYDEPRPPCVMVRGGDGAGRNRIVSAPDSGARALESWARQLRLPLSSNEQTGWMRYPIRQGTTPCMANLSCHASVLSPGKTPHKPHSHPEEELLIVLGGEAQLVIVNDDGNAERQLVRPGNFVYYPSGQVHTIRNLSSSPTTYLMFKWYNSAVADGVGRLRTQVFAYDLVSPEAIPKPGKTMRTCRVFEGRTDCLRKLHCHLTTLTPGGGYEPHVDPYDVAILILAGRVETLGQQLEAHDVVFYSAGEAHGMRNVGQENASYLVFQFHRGAARN
jgi:quercetin dioxygenase-like cupin family protein